LFGKPTARTTKTTRTRGSKILQIPCEMQDNSFQTLQIPYKMQDYSFQRKKIGWKKFPKKIGRKKFPKQTPKQKPLEGTTYKAKKIPQTDPKKIPQTFMHP